MKSGRIHRGPWGGPLGPPSLATLRLRRWLILTHRYLGIALSLLFAMWFLSGIGMIFTGGMPELTARQRLAHLPDLDLGRVRLSPSEAAGRADLSFGVGRFVLTTIMDRPAYRITSARATTIFADNGELLREVGPAAAMTIGARFMNLPEASLHYERRLTTPDQWTIGLRRQMPLHKIVADDRAATELYVSSRVGEVALQTTRRSRTLAWLSAIPHWMYFAPLRRNDLLWRRVVLWTSGLGTAAALIGLALALMQRTVRYTGWMRWHYVTGSVFGAFALTWVFSGMLSLEPWDWTSSGIPAEDIDYALNGGSPDPASFPRIDMRAWNQVLTGRPVKEMEFLRLQDAPYYLVRGGELMPEPVLMRADQDPAPHRAFSIDTLLRRVREGAPDARITESTLLSDYDSYYYARGRAAPLPVLRVKFDDPDRTWMYIDPVMSRVVADYPRRRRLERWLYHGFHSLDFSFWYGARPFWDIGVVALSLGGVTLSAIGVVIGTRRLRGTSRKLKPKK